MPETDLREELEAAIEHDEPFGQADENKPLREISAATLREAILAPRSHPDGAKRLLLHRVLIVGKLDLESQQLGLRLQMTKCELKDALSFRQAHAIDIVLVHCTIGGPLLANQLTLRWNLRLNGSSLHSGATLLGAKVGGQLSISDAKLKPPRDEEGKVAGPAFGADHAEVSGGMFCDGMESEGEVRLLGAKVGELSVERAKLKSARGVDGRAAGAAFSADRLEVSGGMFCRDMESEGEVRLAGAKVGELSVERAKLKSARGVDSRAAGAAFTADGVEVGGGMLCDDMESEGEVRLLGAKVGGQLSIAGTKLKSARGEDGRAIGPAFNADGVEVGGDVFCDEMDSEGEVRLLGAKIGGQLSIAGTKLKPLRDEEGKVAGPAFSADGVEVGGDVFCDDMESEGEVRLLGAKVGELSTARAKLKSARGVDGKAMRPAFNADRVAVGGGMFCRDMESEGEVRLLGAKIGGQLSMNGIKLKPLKEDGKIVRAVLNADRVAVGGGMSCRDMESEGEVRLLGAKIGGQLSMREASLTAIGNDKCGLKLIGAEVDELILAFKEVEGVVDVTDAKVRSLWDAEGGEFSGQLPPALRLQGFRYESLRNPLSAEQRLEWIERSQQDQHQPGVYAELAEAYRRIGHRSDARTIGIASERRGREDGTLVKKIWSWLLWKSVRYGYENWRAAAGLVIVITIGSILFWVAECHFVETVREPPGLSPFIYATDVAIPVLDVGQTRTWAADGWLEWVELVLAISGYAFVAAVVAGLAGIFNRDQV